MPAMSDLIRLGLVLATAAVGQRDNRGIRHTALVAALTVAATGCAIAALTCGLIAVWICLLPFVGAAGAWAIVTGILLALCFALLALGRYRWRHRPPPTAGADVPLLLAETRRLVRDNKSSVLAGALLAGLIAGSGEK